MKKILIIFFLCSCAAQKPMTRQQIADKEIQKAEDKREAKDKLKFAAVCMLFIYACAQMGNQ